MCKTINDENRRNVEKIKGNRRKMICKAFMPPTGIVNIS